MKKKKYCEYGHNTINFFTIVIIATKKLSYFSVYQLFKTQFIIFSLPVLAEAARHEP